MPLVAIAAVGFFGLFGHPHGGHAPSAAKLRESFRVAGWRVDARTDSFDGARACTIRKRRARYEPGGVVISLGPDVDTAQAQYRVDGGPAFSAREAPRLLPDYGRLATALRNPSQGEVVVAESRLVDARRVFVRPAPGAPVFSIDVAGLAQALRAAKDAGC